MFYLQQGIQEVWQTLALQVEYSGRQRVRISRDEIHTQLETKLIPSVGNDLKVMKTVTKYIIIHMKNIQLLVKL